MKRRPFAFFCLLFLTRITAAAQGSPTEDNTAAFLLTERINSSYAESHPFLSPDGRTLFFSRREHPLNFGRDDASDIWVSYYQASEGHWSRAINLGPPLNDERDNRIAGVNTSENRLYLIRNEVPAGQSPILVSERMGRLWGPPRALPIRAFRNESEAIDAFIDGEEQLLLLAIDTGAGRGRRDLYVSFRQADNAWSAPLPLGADLNTAGDEGRMWLAPDGRTLYFASDGYPGANGVDLYMSRRRDDSWTSWTPPQSLGDTINTAGDDGDFTLTADGTRLLITRRIGEAPADFYSVPLPVELRPIPSVLVTGRLLAVYSPDTRLYWRPITARSRPPQPISLQAGGRFKLILPADLPAIAIYAEAAGAFGLSACIPLAANLPKALDSEAAALPAIRSKHPEYERREAQITLLQEQLLRAEMVYQQLQARQLRYDTLRPSQLQLQPIYLNDPYLKELEDQFQQLEGRPPSSTDNSFPSFCYAIWSDMAQALLPAIKWELDSTLAAEALLHQAQSRPPDATTVYFLEQRLARLARQRPPLTATAIATSLARKGPADAASITISLCDALAPPLKQELRSALRPAAEEALQDALRSYQKESQITNLEQELRAAVQAQMALERSAGLLARRSAVTPAPPASGRLPGFREIRTNPTLVPLEAGRRIPLEAVFFEADRAVLLPESNPELQRLAQALRQNPQLAAEINVHTHNRLTHLKAEELTQARAQAIADRLTTFGADPARLFPIGRGKVRSLREDAGPEARLKQQRVEVRLRRVE